MPAFCPLCALEDYASEEVTDDGRRYSICRNPGNDHPAEGFIWEPTPAPGKSARGDGLGAELGIWDKLLDCIPADGVVRSYGEVEDLLFEHYQDVANQLLRRYGHRWRDPEHPSSQYSMSAYLASRLRELEKEGHLTLTFAPATGEWAYNGIISHWQRN